MLYSNWTFALSWAWASHASKEVKDGKTEPDQISRQRGSGMAHHMRILDVWRVMAMVAVRGPPWSHCNSAPGTRPANSVFHWSCHPDPGMLHGALMFSMDQYGRIEIMPCKTHNAMWMKWNEVQHKRKKQRKLQWQFHVTWNNWD